MTDHYECWLRTVQWQIIMSADCELFNDYKLPLCLIFNSAHLELGDSRSWTTVSLTTMINHSIMKMERVNVTDLLTVFVPYFVNIAFLFLSIVSCVQSWDIHIKLTIWLFYYIHIVILYLFKMHFKISINILVLY